MDTGHCGEDSIALIFRQIFQRSKCINICIVMKIVFMDAIKTLWVTNPRYREGGRAGSMIFWGGFFALLRYGQAMDDIWLKHLKYFMTS